MHEYFLINVFSKEFYSGGLLNGYCPNDFYMLNCHEFTGS